MNGGRNGQELFEQFRQNVPHPGSGAGQSAAPQQPPTPGPTPAERRWRWVALILAIYGLVTVLGAIFSRDAIWPWPNLAWSALAGFAAVAVAIYVAGGPGKVGAYDTGGAPTSHLDLTMRRGDEQRDRERRSREDGENNRFGGSGSTGKPGGIDGGAKSSSEGDKSWGGGDGGGSSSGSSSSSSD